MSKNINTYPIQEFIEAVRIADLSQKKEVKLDIKTARNMALNMGELLAIVNQDYGQLLAKLQNKDDQIIELRMDGGGFK